MPSNESHLTQLIKRFLKENPTSVTKICTVCKREFPVHRFFFHQETRSKDGFRDQCKECKNKSNTFKGINIWHLLREEEIMNDARTFSIQQMSDKYHVPNNTIRGYLDNNGFRWFNIISTLEYHEVIYIYSNYLSGVRSKLPDDLVSSKYSYYVWIIRHLVITYIGYSRTNILLNYNGDFLRHNKFPYMSYRNKKTFFQLIDTAFPEYDFKPWEFKQTLVSNNFWKSEENIEDTLAWFINRITQENVIHSSFDLRRHSLKKELMKHGLIGLLEKSYKSSTRILFNDISTRMDVNDGFDPINTNIDYVVEEWLTQYINGSSLIEIGTKYELSFETIGRYITKKYNTTNIPNAVNKRLSEEVIFLYNNLMMTSKEIAPIVGINQKRVLKILKKSSIKLRSLQPEVMYDLNHQYFSVINTDEKAYWLGFIYADGSLIIVEDKNSMALKIEIHQKDLKHLFKFREAIRADNPIKLTRKDCCKISIHNRQICEDLMKHGVHPNKASTIIFPFNSIPKEFHNSFVRGYFDGDGSIFQNKKTKTWHFGITSNSKQMLEDVVNIINSQTENKIHKVYKRKQGGYGITIGGNIQLVKFRSWLYKNVECYLERKKLDFDSITYTTFKQVDLICPICQEPFSRKFKETHLYRKRAINATCCSKECQRVLHPLHLRGQIDEELQNRIDNSVIRIRELPYRGNK